MNAESSEFWDKIAEKYSKQAIADIDSYKRKLASTQGLMNAGMNILEFGCGTGSTALEHAPHVKRIVATDVSEFMIEIGRKKASEAGIQNVTFERSSIYDFEDQEGTYDMILVLNLIHLLEDRTAALEKIHTLLKPNGIFVSSTVCLSEKMWYVRPMISIMQWFGKAPYVSFLKEAALLQEFSEAGFKHQEHWSHGRSHSLFLIAEKV